MLNYFNNIFGTAFNYYSNTKLNVTPRFGASMIVVLFQFLILFLVIISVEKVTKLNATILFSNKIAILLALAVWSALVLRYYDKERVKRIISEFNQKTIQTRNLWDAITVVSIIAPLICIAFLLKK